MSKNKPFTRQEMKILIYNKMKQKGMSYENARKELAEEIEKVRENTVKEEKPAPSFKEQFEKLKNG